MPVVRDQKNSKRNQITPRCPTACHAKKIDRLGKMQVSRTSAPTLETSKVGQGCGYAQPGAAHIRQVLLPRLGQEILT